MVHRLVEPADGPTDRGSRWARLLHWSLRLGSLGNVQVWCDERLSVSAQADATHRQVAASRVGELTSSRLVGASPHREAELRYDRALSGLVLWAVLRHTVVMRQSNQREFSVIVERDAKGYYVASVPALPGCHTQAGSLDKLVERIREAIELCREVDHEAAATEFIGGQRVSV